MPPNYACSPEAQVDAVDGADDGPVRPVVPHVEAVAVLVLEALPEPSRMKQKKTIGFFFLKKLKKKKLKEKKGDKTKST